MNDYDNITTFHKAVPPLSVKTGSRACYYPGCRRLEIDEHRRVIVCKDCCKVVDAFDWLLEQAQKGERSLGSLASVKAEIKVKSQELADLKREIANAESRLKRRLDKLNPPIPLL